VILALIGCRAKDEAPSSSPSTRAPSSATPTVSRQLTSCGNEVLSEQGIGELRIGITVDSLRQKCNVIRDTTAIAAEGMPARKLLVALSRDTVEAEIVNSRVWRIAVGSPRLRTADALGVGTLIGRLRQLKDPRGITGEGQLFVVSPDHCGMSFRLSRQPPAAQRGELDRRGLFQLSEATVVTEVLIFGCRLTRAPRPGGGSG
jgi:hypothetical protein